MLLLCFDRLFCADPLEMLMPHISILKNVYSVYVCVISKSIFLNRYKQSVEVYMSQCVIR